MKTQVKKIDQHKRELTVEVEGDIVKQKFSQVYDRINKEAKVPGFRPGNVPLDILEKRFSNIAHQEVLKELVPLVYNQALGEAKLEPVNMPDISQVNLGKDRLSFKANLEVKPGIDLKQYKNLPVEFKPIQVGEDEINSALNKLKQNYQQLPEDELAHSLGYPNLAVFREVIQRQIYLEKARAQQINLENGIIENLLSQVNFQVPASLINQQLDNLVRQAGIDLALRGMSREEIEKQAPEIRKNFAPQAEQQVRIFLVLEEVARRENIAQDDKMTKQVVEFLLRQADWNQKGGRD